MQLRFTDRFRKSLRKLDSPSRKAVQKALELLSVNPRHPSLRTRKMEGYRRIFEASATMNIRITFHYEEPDILVLRNCGHHDDTLGNP
ncbi:MAG: type II toxin-antitoxin system RelE family toxin [Bacilli bacterium]